MPVGAGQVEVFSQDMIGRSIMGCIDHVSGQILLLDDGRTIEISDEHLSPGEGFWIGIGSWKPKDTLTEGSHPAQSTGNGRT